MRFYCASITPGCMRLAGEITEVNLPIFMSQEGADLVIKPTLEGMAKASSPRSLNDFAIAPYAKIRIGDDLQACRDAVKPELALYIGGMGAVGKNFYNDYCKRLGFPDAAAAIQKAFLAGHRKEALAAVPDALVDEIALVGPADRVRARLRDWQTAAREGKLNTLVLNGATQDALRLAAEAVL
jgi:alkanesulfonate monooxygenase SsuD/methylene tetrahydromethanopterin reductase-like flavin-dependent oxidoreductase (luciferase family)